MKKLLIDIKNCTTCIKFLEHGINPIMSASPSSKIAVVGQAPGRIVHETGIPWDDKSGERLREWLGISDEDFYDNTFIALVPMGFCYPGTGKSGDLPPRPECAPKWHKPVFEAIKDLQLTLLIGQYAQHYYLENSNKRTLTETVKNYKEYLPKYLPLPHPSPRNNIWLKKNPWFQAELIPELQRIIQNFKKS